MILLLLAGVAHADPDVLRHPTQAYGISVGTPGVSAARWFGDEGVALSVRATSVGLHVAARTPVRTGWRAGVGAGLVVPLTEVGAGIETVGWFGPAWYGRWAELGVDLVAPAAVSLVDATARVGGRLEPRVGVHVAGWSASVSGGMGVVQATDSGWALDLRTGLALGWDAGRARPDPRP